MTFTLRIIFFGLIALKPSGDEKELTALLVDAKRAGIDHIHEPLLYLLQGRFVDGQRFTLQRLNIGFRSKSFTEEKLRSSGAEVFWSLSNSEVNFLELKDSTVGHGLRYRPGKLDLDPGQIFSDTDDLKWIPAMSEFFHQPLLDACITGDIDGCPFSARVRLEGNGLTRSCHHVHDTVDGSDRIYAFNFVNGDGDVLKSRPIVDATVAEFHVSADSVTIQAKDLRTKIIRSVKIRPVNPGGTVTLMVANHPKEETSSSHFEAYYSLVKEPRPKKPFRPVHDSSIQPKVKGPGPCERDIELYSASIAAVARKIKEVVARIPHDKPQCDSIQF